MEELFLLGVARRRCRGYFSCGDVFLRVPGRARRVAYGMAGRVLVLNGLTTTTVELEIWTAVLSLDATVVGVVLVYLALDALDLII